MPQFVPRYTACRFSRAGAHVFSTFPAPSRPVPCRAVRHGIRWSMTIRETGERDTAPTSVERTLERSRSRARAGGGTRARFRCCGRRAWKQRSARAAPVETQAAAASACSQVACAAACIDASWRAAGQAGDVGARRWLTTSRGAGQ